MIQKDKPAHLKFSCSGREDTFGLRNSDPWQPTANRGAEGQERPRAVGLPLSQAAACSSAPLD